MRNDKDLGRTNVNPFDENQYGSNTGFRRATTAENFAGFFGLGPARKSDKQVGEELSIQLGGITNAKDAIFADVQDFSKLSFDQVKDSGAFKDELAFMNFKNDLPKDSRDVTPSLAITLGKATGKEGEGISKANTLQTALGNEYKIFGQGKRLDWLGSQYGINEDGIYSITNPSIRTMGRKEDGGTLFYSADMTTSGENFSDMTDEDIASDRAKLGTMQQDDAGKPITTSEYLDVAFKALSRDKRFQQPGAAQAEAMGDIMMAAAADSEEKKELYNQIISENTGRAQSLDAAKKIIEIDRQKQPKTDQESTGGSGITLTETDSLFGLKERVATADTKEEVLEAIKQFRDAGDTARGYYTTGVRGAVGQIDVPGDITTRNFNIYPKGTVYGIDKTQLGLFSIEEQQKLRKESDTYRNGLLNSASKGAEKDIKTRIREERTADPEDGISTDDRRNNIKTVNEFYSKKNGFEDHKKLVDQLSANPEKLQEYLNDPYEFALNNDPKTIFGEEISPADDKKLRDSLGPALKAFPKIKKALDEGKPIEEIISLIDNAKANINRQSDDILSIPAVAAGNLGQASPVARFAALMRIAAELPDTSLLKKNTFTAENIQNFLTYGTFIAPKEVEGPDVDQGLTDSLLQSTSAILENISEVNLLDARQSGGYKKVEATFRDVNNDLANANLKFREYIANYQNNPAQLQDGKFLGAAQDFKNANARFIQKQIEGLAGVGWFKSALEYIPFFGEYMRTPVAFGNVASRLGYDKNAEEFFILEPGGGRGPATISKSDILGGDGTKGNRGGRPLFDTMLRMAEINAFIEQNRQ